MAALSQLLAVTGQSDAHAKAALWETVYRELRAMAAQKMASEREVHTFQLGVNEKTVRRQWELAKVFLFRAIQNAPPDSAELLSRAIANRLQEPPHVGSYNGKKLSVQTATSSFRVGWADAVGNPLCRWSLA